MEHRAKADALYYAVSLQRY